VCRRLHELGQLVGVDPKLHPLQILRPSSLLIDIGLWLLDTQVAVLSGKLVGQYGYPIVYGLVPLFIIDIQIAVSNSNPRRKNQFSSRLGQMNAIVKKNKEVLA